MSRDTSLTKLAKATFDPVLTQQQVFETEAAQEKRWGVVRRTALMFLTLSKDEAVKRFSEDPADADILMDGIKGVANYLVHLRALVDLMNSAQARMMSVGAVIQRGERKKSRGAA